MSEEFKPISIECINMLPTAEQRRAYDEAEKLDIARLLYAAEERLKEVKKRNSRRDTGFSNGGAAESKGDFKIESR